MADETLRVIVDTQSNMPAVMKESEDSVTRWAGVTQKDMGLAGASIVGAFVLASAVVLDFAKTAGEEQKGVALLGTAVRNTGADWGIASAAIEVYLSAELRRTALDDGAGRAAIQKLTEATGSYETALDLMAITQDLAAAKGIDLSTAATLVGKVHEGNTGVLGRYGIVLEEGTSAEDALIIMHERFGGAAEAVGNTYAGSMEKLNVSTGNLKETIGAALIPLLTPMINLFVDLAQRAIPLVEGAMKALQPVFNWLSTDGKPIAIALGVIIGVVLVAAFYQMGLAAALAAAPVIAALGAILIPLLPFIAIVAGIGILITAIGLLWKSNWGGMQEKTAAVLAWFTGAWATVSGWLTTSFTVGIPKALTAAGTAFENLWKSIVAWLTDLGSNFGTFFGGLGARFVAWFSGPIQAIRDFGATALAAIKGPFQEAWDWLTGLWGTVGDWLKNIFSNIHIPMPHFHIDWGEVLGVRIPVGFGVDWYGSGLDAVFNQPTLIGVGEAGAERVQVTPVGGGGKGGSGDTWNIEINTTRDAASSLQNLLTMLQMARP